MDPTVTLILSVSGAVIILLLSVVGFFLGRIISDVRKNTGDIGKNKGSIELVKQQQANDVKRIEENTQLEIRNMAREVSTLSTSVNTLVTALAEKSLKEDG